MAGHTPRRTALKWEPPRTVREELLALSRKTEVYCPACGKVGVSLDAAGLRVRRPHTVPTPPRPGTQHP